jgi:DNA-binding MarR family transcriptional regulator
MAQQDQSYFFAVFNEIGIIEQLARALLEAQMPKGLIAPHFGVLNHLVRVADGRTPVELARAFQVPKTTLTHTVAGLRDHGLVDVRPNPNDRRSKCVWLTDKGRAFRQDLIASLEPEFKALAEGFDPAKLQAILPILSELREFLDHRRNAEPPRDRPAQPPGS